MVLWIFFFPFFSFFFFSAWEWGTTPFSRFGLPGKAVSFSRWWWDSMVGIVADGCAPKNGDVGISSSFALVGFS